MSTPNTDAGTQKVLDHHMGAFAKGLDELLRDYDEMSVLVTPDKTFTGTAEIRAFFKAFIEGADPKFWEAFKILKISVTGEIAYLVWEAKPWVPLATDTFCVKNERIVVQTFTPFGG
jgi:ketosteroid isomerase-like protein